MTAVPDLRVSAVNDQPIRGDGDYVVYWMIAQRRTRWNFGLQQAVARARELGKPLLILEALRCGYRWASDRLHRFVLEGMADNLERCDRAGVRYLAYVEDEAGAGKGLLEALAGRACLVVTDEFPCFFLPRMVAAAGESLAVRLEQVDGNGLLPLRATDSERPTAYAFRRVLHRTLAQHLGDAPQAEPLRSAAKLGKAVVPRAVLDRWKFATTTALTDGLDDTIAALPIDHEVRAGAIRGGAKAGEAAARLFLEERLPGYVDDRNQPESEATSGLSPYLHFGHVSVHEVFARLAANQEWSVEQLPASGSGQREGWWGMSAPAESFLDELVTWRELGYAFCHHRAEDYDRFESLPDWAIATLDKHAGDPREHVYDLDEFERLRTHDELWNAAQAQLVREGRMHNYLRMLWGKKILEWSATPRDALEVMIELNNKYALDGRDPNSYSGIFWTLGRFDRPWPERDVFGVIRYMSSANTARKLRVKSYIETHLRRGLFSGS